MKLESRVIFESADGESGGLTVALLVKWSQSPLHSFQMIYMNMKVATHYPAHV